MSRVLITGITGQDGSYLAELLISRGHDVHGTCMRPDEVTVEGATVHEVDLLTPGIAVLVKDLLPDEIYNLAALSSVVESWRTPMATAQVNAIAVAEMLAALHDLKLTSGHSGRFIQASSAEIFGSPTSAPQTEQTPIRPTTPYGAAKAYAHGLVNAYRAAGTWASSCILYNHESPRRTMNFVTRKITSGVARISLGLQDNLELGSLTSRRDWGWAPDYVDAMARAASADLPDDYIIATGVDHSVGEFVAAAFERVGIVDWKRHVTTSGEFVREVDAPLRIGDATHAREALGWAPTVDFDGIVAAMVDNDLALLG